MLPKDVCLLILQIWRCVTGHGAEDFAGVVRLRIWVWKIILGYPGGPSRVIRVIVRRRKMSEEEGKGSRTAESEGTEGDITMEAEFGRDSQVPRSLGSL